MNQNIAGNKLVQTSYVDKSVQTIWCRYVHHLVPTYYCVLCLYCRYTVYTVHRRTTGRCETQTEFGLWPTLFELVRAVLRCRLFFNANRIFALHLFLCG